MKRLLLLVLLLAGVAQAQTQPAPPAQATIALFHLEPLGLDAERAERLEVLFRLELERLAGAPLANRAAIERALAKDAALRSCTGEVECLAAIGKKLGVKQIASGNVAQLGDSYVVNLKLVDVDTKAEVRKISEPLKGNPDELIDAVRVAAYELVAPERLVGAIGVLSDVNGALVSIDGKAIGKTPLAKPVADLSVGKHTVALAAAGYTSFTDDVDVHFQKTTQLEVRMIAAKPTADGRLVPVGAPRPAKTPWYASKWGYIGIGAAAVIVGVVVGSAVATRDSRVTNCDQNPSACGISP